VVVFDWNGTLADDVADAIAATNAVLADAGLQTLSGDGFRAAFALPLEAFFRALGLPEDALGAAAAQWNEGMAGRPARLTDGAPELMRALRGDGARLGVVSAASSAAIADGVARLERESGEQLDFVAASAADKTASIAAVVREARAPVIYVGDTEYDVVSARQAGARAVAFTAGYRPRPALEAAGADWVVDDLRELVAIARSEAEGVAA
jgi:phosphoglycolate phosphatase